MNPDPFKRIRIFLGLEDDVGRDYARLTWSGDGTSNNKPGRETKMATKNLFVVTMPATLTVVAEGADSKEATAAAIKAAEAVLGKSLGILHVVGDAKATPVTVGKAAKVAAPKDDDEDEDDDEEEEDDEEEDEEEEESDDEDEDEEDDDDDEEPAPKKKGKKDDKKSDGGKKKIKIKLKG